MNPLKKFILSVINDAGYDIQKRTNDAAQAFEKDLSLYRELYSAESIKNKAFYNVGSGSFSHPYWTNLDYISEWYSDIQKEVTHIDLMKLEPLPIGPETAEIIYTSHTIEHIKDKAVENLFSESYKALRPGGILRVTTGPDADTDFSAMLRGDIHWYYWDTWYDKPGTYEEIYYKPASSVPLEERWLHHVASQLAPNDKSPSKHKFDAQKIRNLVSEASMEEVLDYFTGLCEFQSERVGNHVSWWNFEKIKNYMLNAGFSNVYRSAYSQSHSPVLRNTAYFDNTHPQISVYVEAKK